MQSSSDWSLTNGEIEILRCPACSAALELADEPPPRDGSGARQGYLECSNSKCERDWPIIDGVPRLLDSDSVPAADSFLNFVYDAIAPFHDFGTAVALPMAQCVSDRTVRSRIVDRLDLASLQPRKGSPLRILEVGAGTGINWPIIEEKLPVHLDVELWAVDLSVGMLTQARRRATREVGRKVRPIRADAHKLPFADGSFDRVFHIGAVATFGDPAQALGEMARVAKPGSPIVLVDERLDPDSRHPIFRRVLFKALTWYDPNPGAPGEDLLPKGCEYKVEQVSPFFYCMTLRVPSVQKRKK